MSRTSPPAQKLAAAQAVLATLREACGGDYGEEMADVLTIVMHAVTMTIERGNLPISPK